ncbi:MAG: NUDIX hydrolase [Dehalococcoidia bacterium]|nr:NUDIX hydrolase [Dehalococcoidia bacterium]MCB9486372.1 NUDIX hydrolase [Thermoflexaceae bacterium]
MYELGASVVLWRGGQVLLMKRTGGVGAGGWFLPGGHIEGNERPVEAAVREVREETGIDLDLDGLSLAEAMTYPGKGGTAHLFIYNARCPDGAEAEINGEHHVARWYTPDVAIRRFYDAAMLRARGVSEDAIAMAAEVARVIRAAERARGIGEAGPFGRLKVSEEGEAEPGRGMQP